jgi:hypothetical protein
VTLLGGLCAALLAAQQLVWAAQSDYADSVDRALQTLRVGPADDPQVARQAAGELQAGTGDSQPEILDELRATPPSAGEARARLTALSAAARSPAFTPEPRRAGSVLRDILAQPRYAGLNAGPSWTDRLGYLVLTLLVWLLERGGGGALSMILWATLGAGAICLVVMLFFLLRAIRRGPRREARQTASKLEQAARDRFAEADRLAAAGDLTGAVRSLAGAVAAALGDDRDWDRSPLTVREIFARAPQPEALRPLLAVFEAAVYGALPPEPEDYDRAAAAAAPFRPRPERAAA